MKIFYRQTAKDDIVRQFRYYLVTISAPEVALRFRQSVARTVASLAEHPLMGPS